MSLQEEIIETLKSDNLIDLIADIGETTIDSLIENDAFKEIPILVY